MLPRPPTSTLFPYTTLFRSDERPLELVDQRTRVDQLVAVDAGQRAADDVAPDVAAGLGERQPDRVQLVQHHRQVLDRQVVQDRKSTRLNSSHVEISYAVFCL